VNAALLFDAHGNSLLPGGQPIDTHDLRRWPVCRIVVSEHPESGPDVIALLPSSGGLVSNETLGVIVRALDMGKNVVFHAPDDAAMATIWRTLTAILGAAGHA
jgi:hypothetical protein